MKTPKLAPTEQEQQRLVALFSGKEAPSSPFVAYIIERVNEIRAEREEVIKQITNVDAQLKQLVQRREDLEAQHNAYIDDVRVWEGKTDAASVGAAAPRKALDSATKSG